MIERIQFRDQYRTQISSLCQSTSHLSPRNAHQFPQHTNMNFTLYLSDIKEKKLYTYRALGKIIFPVSQLTAVLNNKMEKITP